MRMKYILCPYDNIVCTVCIINTQHFKTYVTFYLEDVLNKIQDEGFKILLQRQIVLSEEEAKTLCKEYENKDYFGNVIENMTR